MHYGLKEMSQSEYFLRAACISQFLSAILSLQIELQQIIAIYEIHESISGAMELKLCTLRVQDETSGVVNYGGPLSKRPRKGIGAFYKTLFQKAELCPKWRKDLNFSLTFSPNSLRVGMCGKN